MQESSIQKTVGEEAAFNKPPREKRIREGRAGEGRENNVMGWGKKQGKMYKW